MESVILAVYVLHIVRVGYGLVHVTACCVDRGLPVLLPVSNWTGPDG